MFRVYMDIGIFLGVVAFGFIVGWVGSTIYRDRKGRKR